VCGFGDPVSVLVLSKGILHQGWLRTIGFVINPILELARCGDRLGKEQAKKDKSPFMKTAAFPNPRGRTFSVGNKKGMFHDHHQHHLNQY
jgi:hypothetical protein